MKSALAFASLFSVLLPAIAATGSALPPAVRPALAAIDANRLLSNIKTLSSDEFQGRAPGTEGETVTVAWLQDQFKRMGLKPGNPDGSYVQHVPLAGVTSQVDFSWRIGATTLPLKAGDDFVAWSTVPQREVTIDASELVFVGYGVVAPEYGWDDYKGMDLKGKTLVMLINDPAIPDPADPTQLDPAMFKGDGTTYYGRWTYKFDMAAKLGAAAAIIVHETKPAAYPFDVVRKSWGRENFGLKTEGASPDFPPVPGWMQLDRAKAMFQAAGLDFDELKQRALSKDFRPVSLGGTASFHVVNTWREIDSDNVVAKIEGSDPRLKAETVVYSAHWDHFGIDTALPGPRTKQIFHGAQDNAAGVSALLELANAFRHLKTPPRRSILFIATTGEEQGLLGAKYYGQHPLYPLARTLADINIDGLNVLGRTGSIEIVGSGQSTMEDIAARYARTQGRAVRPDSRAAAGRFYRADHFEFAKQGVPVLYTKSGTDYLGRPATFGPDRIADFTAHDYHNVTDIVHEDWDLSGAVEDVQLLFLTGWDVAQGRAWPAWKAGSEFKGVRDGMLKASSPSR